MRSVQEGGVRNPSPIGDPGMREGAIGINHQGLPALLVFSQGVIESLFADDQPRVFKLALVEGGKMLPMPPGKVRNGLCYLKNSPFLGKSASKSAQNIPQSKACKENTGLTRAPERLSGEPPELGRPIVGKTAFKLDPARMQREHPIVLNEGKGCAIGGAGFGEGDSRLHVEAAAVSTGRRGIRYKSTRDSLGIFRRLNFLQRC
tara:strand:- start:804 stop:1415 length:612 start_codon:yes stop_codon:yes gene_type:complete